MRFGERLRREPAEHHGIGRADRAHASIAIAASGIIGK